MGVPTGTGQKNGLARRSRKSGEGLTSVMERMLPFDWSPDM